MQILGALIIIGVLIALCYTAFNSIKDDKITENNHT